MRKNGNNIFMGINNTTVRGGWFLGLVPCKRLGGGENCFSRHFPMKTERESWWKLLGLANRTHLMSAKSIKLCPPPKAAAHLEREHHCQGLAGHPPSGLPHRTVNGLSMTQPQLGMDPLVAP